MTERLIGCEEALRLLAAYLDGELSDRSGPEVGRHLETCRSCYSRAEFERGLQARLAELGRREPEPALVQRIRRLVRAFSREPESSGS